MKIKLILPIVYNKYKLIKMINLCLIKNNTLYRI